MRSYSCACLALYGCEERLTAQTWLGVAERYFQYLGVSPTLCVVTFTSGQIHSFDWNAARARVGAAARGTLTRIGGGNSLWAVPTGGIPAVREELKAAGLIIADERM